MTRRRVLLALLIVAVVAVVLLKSTEWLLSFGGVSHRKFRNPQPSPIATGSLREMARRQFFGKEQRSPLGVIPVVTRTARDYATPPASGLRATWIGWSSVLVEIDGRVILTDPIWSERCSPSTLVGPKRFHPPPIPLAELPRVDAVVISHDHYDHLDMATVRALAARGTHFAVPLGVGVHLARWRVPANQVHELGWNETVIINGLTLTATPARHYSGRRPFHKDETLWASWVVRGPQHRVFYSGDTGYADHFRAIGAAYGPFDLTLMKIGASDPTWSAIHMTPEEAVQAHLDVRGRVMVPVHWATFNLAFHAWRDPADRALAAATRAGATLVIPRPGAFVEPSQPLPPPDPWWGGAATGGVL